jgi:DNA polymerase-3 subunit gamma/tau
VGERRDAKLKVHLEEHVSLVKFDAGAGSIDIFLLPGAPPQIANELREKLIAWTQRRWIVMLSKSAGDRALGEVRREREAAELEALKSHPALKAVLDEFPDAKIAAVRPLAGPPMSETDTDETGTDG